jgi:hypothetical protein
MVVPFELLDSFDKPTLEVVTQALNDVSGPYGEWVENLSVAPGWFEGDWQAAVLSGLTGDDFP